MGGFVGFDSLFGGKSLGFLFGVTDTGALYRFTDVDADSEGLVVVRALLAQSVIDGGFAVDALGEFLEIGLGVAPRAFFEDFVYLDEDVLFDEALGGLVALVEVDSTDDCFETVGEDDSVSAVGAVLFTTAEADERSIAEFFASGADGLGADEGGAPRGHNAFGLVVIVEQKVGGDELEYGVTEELEAFVVSVSGFFVFVDVTAVGEGSDEKVDVVELKT